MVVLVTVVNEVVVSAALVVSVTAPCFGDVDDVYHDHLKIRVEISRDRHDRRSCKIFANCVNFPGKQCNFLHNMRRSTIFTHTK